MSNARAFKPLRLPPERPGGVSSWVVLTPPQVEQQSVWWANSYLQSFRGQGKSLATEKNSAVALSFYCDFLAGIGEAWEQSSVSIFGGFTEFLQRPNENVIPLVGGASARSSRTINLYRTLVFEAYSWHKDAGHPPSIALLKNAAGASRPRGTGGYVPKLAGYAPSVSSPSLGRLKETKKRVPKPLTRAEQEALLAWRPRLVRDQLYVFTFWATGLRNAQVRSLRNENVSISSDGVRLEVVRLTEREGSRHDTSAKSDGTVWVRPGWEADLWASLYADYRFERPYDPATGVPVSPFLFCNVAGGVLADQISPSNHARIFAAARDWVSSQLEQPCSFSAHDLRHALGFDLHSSAVSPQAIKIALTHRSIESQNVYGELTAAQANEHIARKLNEGSGLRSANQEEAPDGSN